MRGRGCGAGVGALTGGAGASARTMAIDVGGCRTWDATAVRRAARRLRQRVDGVDAMRVRCCEAAW